MVSDPEQADLILFVETGTHAGQRFQLVRGHELYRQRRRDCCLFSSLDRAFPALPGVYASIPAGAHDRRWSRPGQYLAVRERGRLTPGEPRRPALLFSFAGRLGTHPIRARLAGLEHPRGELLDSGQGSAEPSGDQAKARFVEMIRDSAFVLCPRGIGSSSFRLFETMLLGRVPVIISDSWVEPEGPEWSAFSIRVPESETDSIPALLEDREGDAAEMGAAARRAWEEWFAEDIRFHHIVNTCLNLLEGGAGKSRRPLRAYKPLLRIANR